jgi:ATP-dependent protease ClpP protease subunit
MEAVEIRVEGFFEDEMSTQFEQQMAALTTPCVCVLDIESYGGYVYVFEKMANLISAKKEQGFVFVTNVEKYAMSAGFMLFLMGDIKIVSDTAELMYHAPGIFVFDRLTAREAKIIYETLAASDELTDKIFLEHTNISTEMFALLKKNTTFFGREDLIHLGIMENEYTF